MSTKIKKHTGVIFGILLILLGGLFLSASLGLSDFKSVIISWQMLLIAIGIVSIWRHPFSGFCLILVGGFFLIPKLAEVFPDSFPYVNEDFTSNYWAVLLIVAGIFWIIIPHRRWHSRRCERRRFHRHHRHYCNWENTQYNTNSGFSKTHIFSSGEYIVSEPEFKGGEVKTIFGASEIDLRKTSLPEGDTYLKVEAIFSGVTLLIPDDWKVETRIEGAFSGVSDKRRIVEPVNPSRRLILVGACVFGGCEIIS